MTAMTSELRKIVTEARPVIEEWLALSQKMAGFRELADSKGFEWSQIKALLKAQILDEQDETGNGKRVKNLLDKADSTTAYADMLGLSPNLTENNFSSEAA